MRKKLRLDEQQYFTWDYLMRLKDRNGNVPEIFMACSRVRGPGKTTDIGRQMLAQWRGEQCPLADLIGTRRKICILTSKKQMLGLVARGTLSSAINVHYPGLQVWETIQAKTYSEIHMRTPGETEDDPPNEEVIGYVIPLNSRKEIKEISGMFLDVGVMFMDEFISPDNTYVPDFANKILDIHNSIARGFDSSPQADPNMARYVPLFLAANCISQDNPLFLELQLTQNLQNSTRIYRGVSVVYQRCENTHAVNKQTNSRFNQAFAQSGYLDSKGWMIDDFAACEKPSKSWGRSYYDATLIVEGTKYGAFWYPSTGYLYICHSVDETCPHVYNATIDGAPNVPYLRSGGWWKTLRDSLHSGLVRFQDNQCARAVLYTCR